MTLVWQQADARAENEMNRLEGDEPAGSGEFGFMTSVFDADILANIVRQTATQPVSERATELIREITYVTEYVRPGHLTAR
jgi:hypothetical protein